MPRSLILKILTYPIAFIGYICYSNIVKIRNLFYKKSIFKTYSIPIPSICVGNITIGGTGKTPMIAYLIELLSPSYEIGVLSRGYGRDTKGFLQVSHDNVPKEVGDEALQLFKHYAKKSLFFVCENRVEGYKKIKEKFPKLNLLLLDDGFQHRAIKAKIQFVLINFYQPVFEDYLLPLGLLREPKNALDRADAIIVTKCPNEMNEGKKMLWKQEINHYLNCPKPIFFSTTHYHPPYQQNDIHAAPLKKKTKIILITGIANPIPIETYVDNTFTLIEHLAFADHQSFKKKEIKIIYDSIVKNKAQDIVIMTTEKDYVRLKGYITNGHIFDCKIYSLPISIRFLEDDIIFDNFLQQQLN